LMAGSSASAVITTGWSSVAAGAVLGVCAWEETARAKRAARAMAGPAREVRGSMVGVLKLRFCRKRAAIVDAHRNSASPFCDWVSVA